MTIANLITDYLSAVEKCLVLFDRKFGRRDLVRAWREGAIPQTGELAGGIEYQMHGVGCGVEYTDHDVDFDFANQHEVGFDAWRLWQYSTQFPDLYPDYQERDAVEAALAEGLSGGIISRVESKYPGESNDKLLRLSKTSGV
ncbi:MAG TPA: hypothetical protein VEZ48_04800 [Sphingomonadaceae bacterium]|nr:hypothetical protein [Sphingomonadaceae bacterium]